ncbi:MAG: protease SohB [Bdellovibrionales bacterium]|nr:protease SohB [Bdellovibrionales bacterium]
MTQLKLKEVMEYLIEFLLFFAKTLVIVLGILAVIGFALAQSMKGHGDKPHLELERLNDTITNYADALRKKIFASKAYKEYEKRQKKQNKDKEKTSLPKVFVIDFEGDIKASGVKNLRNEVSTVLEVATPQDEVVVRVSSPGGMVHTYGLAAAQLTRIKNAKIPLCVSVDKVAASGGYLMACTADKIIASPFAILGSIGVLAQVPNFHRLLKKNNIDYEEYTAGDYKRTISMFGEITEKGKEKFNEQIADTHELFKNFVKEHRPIVDIDKVATGEPWFGKRALEHKLIDEIKTSDEYFFERYNTHEIVKIKLADKKKFGEKIAEQIRLAFTSLLEQFRTH